MRSFYENMRPYVDAEIAQYSELYQQGDHSTSFIHLENAHVLGQKSVFLHLKVHFLMLKWGIKQKSFFDTVGQVLRIIDALSLVLIKGAPEGNIGSSRTCPFRGRPIASKLAIILKTVSDNN